MWADWGGGILTPVENKVIPLHNKTFLNVLTDMSYMQQKTQFTDKSNMQQNTQFTDMSDMEQKTQFTDMSAMQQNTQFTCNELCNHDSNF